MIEWRIPCQYPEPSASPHICTCGRLLEDHHSLFLALALTTRHETGEDIDAYREQLATEVEIRLELEDARRADALQAL